MESLRSQPLSCRANMSPNFLQILILLFIVSSFLVAISTEPRSLLSCLRGCSLLVWTLRRRCLPSCLQSPRVYGCHSVMCHRTRSYSSLDTVTLNNLLPIHLLSEAPHQFYRTYMHICTAMTFSCVYITALSICLDLMEKYRSLTVPVILKVAVNPSFPG